MADASPAPEASSFATMLRTAFPVALLRARAVSSIGATFGICIAGMLTAVTAGSAGDLPLLAAPLGASAVLVFVMPHSEIAQPWPVICGNTIAALTGVAVALIVPDKALAAGLAVGLAIFVMSLARALHPPGGGMALTAVIAGQHIHALGFRFAFAPVFLNAVVLVVAALAFHKFSGLAYPASAGSMRENIAPAAL